MECVTCVCVWLGRCSGEWVTGLTLGFTNPGGTCGKWDMCLRFGYDGVGGGEWLGGLGQGLGGWVVYCYVCVCCESRFVVLMAGICILC